jgi:hypothetical protein
MLRALRLCRALVVRLSPLVVVSSACGDPGPGLDPAADAAVPAPDAEDGVGPVPRGVRALDDAPEVSFSAAYVDPAGRIWLARGDGAGGGVYRRDGARWVDASAGLETAIDTIAAFHETPAGELFACGARAGWRLEEATWVARLRPQSCVTPLRLTSRGDELFGLCAYYPYYASWPSRDPDDVAIDVFTAPGGHVMGDVAALGDALFAISGPDYRGPTLLEHHAGDLGASESWASVELPAEAGGRDLLDLWPVGPDELVVVGSGGLALTRRGGAWSVEDTGTSADLLAVWGTPADGVYAVGAAGAILFRGPGGWRPVAGDTSAHLLAVHGRTGGPVVIAGEGGTALEIVRD